MINKVREYIQKEELLEPADRVVLGVSGGADSVCMLLVLWRLAGSVWPGLSLHVVHVNHGLRGADSDGDEAWVKRLCEEMGLPFESFCPDVEAFCAEHGVSLEEGGRELRYRCFQQAADRLGGGKIAVAHNQDDCGETILFNLFRGSGLKGLSGIPGKRGRIVRPLLCCSRQEILAYLERSGRDYRTDMTNFGNDYARNRIRNLVLPLVKEQINERAEENILHAGSIIRQADELMSEMAAAFCRKQVKTKGDGEVSIPAAAFLREKPIVQSYILRSCLEMTGGGLKDITAGHIERMRELAGKETGKWLDLPRGIYACSGYGYLKIGSRKMKNVSRPPFQVVFDKFPYEQGREIPQNSYTKWFDYDKIQGTLVVRSREEGDYFTLAGGGRKTVKSYMIDQKIPREERDQIPLLADGKHILWIIGFRISEGYKVTDGTKRILQAEYVGGKYNGR